MTISLQKLMLKMEEELRLAKRADNESARREKIHCIKTLCELILDEPIQQGVEKLEYGGSESGQAQEQGEPQYIPVQPSYPQHQVPMQQPSPLMPVPKRLETEDESNGDSLFDF